MEDDWMVVDMAENGAIAIPESQVELAGIKERINFNAMKTYYICDGSGSGTPQNLFQILPKIVSRRPKAVLLILSIPQTLEPPTENTSFPSRISQIHYQVKCARDKRSDDLAERIKELLVGAGFKCVVRQEEETLVRGGEYAGTQSAPIFYNYISEIPVCQISVLQSKRDGNGSFHYCNVGRALAALKHEDVLILGCLTRSVCNYVETSNPSPANLAFDKWLTDCLLNNRFEEIIQNEERIRIPAPLLVALGAAGEGAIAERLHDGSGWSFSSPA